MQHIIYHLNIFIVILVLSLSFCMHCNKSHIITESNINNPSLFLFKFFFTSDILS